MAQELTIVQQENIQVIVSAAPQSYQDNKTSRERCIAAGQALFDALMQQGMTDDLDQQIASYIEKSRKTVKMMNERRSPVTKLFDDIRKEFTTLENDIDPTKIGTIPYRLQVERNRYAAKKREEEERRRREEMARQKAEQDRKKYLQDIEDDINNQYTSMLNQSIRALTSLYDSVTLANYDEVEGRVKATAVALPDDFQSNLCFTVSIPDGLTVAEARKIEDEVKDNLLKKFSEMYAWEIQENKDYILNRLPSKKANLERIEKANAEEAARITAEMEERSRKDAAAKEEERKRKEEEERAKAEMERKTAELAGLFSTQDAVLQSFQPKVKVSQKIELLNPEGIMAIFSMWWSKEGCNLSTEELSKMFKKQITFCEKLANKDGIFIEDESVCYVEDVKAR